MESDEAGTKNPGTTDLFFKGVRFYVSGEINDDVSTTSKFQSVFCICNFKNSLLGD